MKKLITLVLFVTAISCSVNAQKISGTVKDELGKNIENSTAALLYAKDSAVVKLVVTGAGGGYSFQAGSGSYVVSASHIGHTTAYSKVLEVTVSGDVDLGTIILSKLPADLKDVTVSSKKNMVEVTAGKMVLNVEGTINATGSTALDLLRKSPGVMTDKDDKLSLAGKNGVRIYVDGKPSPLTGADLANYLKSLQSSQIESIEIITSPSTKYDAAGNAGIINIRVKKNKIYGTNGSLNAGYNIGVYSKYNGGFAFNHRNKGVNIFGNYNYNDTKQYIDFNVYRSVLDTIFDNTTLLDVKNKSHGFTTGADLFINNKNTLGILLSGNISDNSFNNYGRTPIIYKPTGAVDRMLVSNNSNKMQQNNANFNLNYRFADTSGHELTIDSDYGVFRNDGNQLQPNYYYNPSGNVLLNQSFYRFISPTDIDIYTLKADYEQNFKKGKIGIGAKTAFVNTRNNFQRFNVQQLDPEQKQLDLSRSNQFDYKENINALYVNYNKQLKGVMLQVGLRMENTTTTGDSYGLNVDGSVNKTNKQGFERKYTDFFPNVALTFNKNPEMQWGLSHSRRIDRPAYQDLNPFEFKLDEYSFLKGNTSLRPQYTNIITLSNTYKYKLNTSLSYSRVADVITQLADTTENSKSFTTRKNLATQDVVALNISYPFTHKNYSAFVNFSGNYSKYKADFGGGSRIVDISATSFNLYMQHSLKFGKKEDWTAEISGWYNSPFIWEGSFKSKTMWTLDAGIQKVIVKGKGTFKVSVTDIFFGMKYSGESNFGSQKTIASGTFESRQLKTSFSWKLGSNTVKASRDRKDAAEEEKKRTKSSGGLGGGN